jgi:D-alanyl-D-alanine carboxypeptidase (penicillin-binding protein 5/6)
MEEPQTNEIPTPPVLEPTIPNNETAPVIPERTYGLIALCLIFVASAFTTFQYFQNKVVVLPEAHTAAALEATQSPFTVTTLQAKSAFVYDLKTNQILYSLNPDAQLPLASITKVAMALAVSEVLDGGELIKIPYDTARDGSAERLAAGATWHVKDILTFTLVASSNAGAEILADAANDNIHARYPRSPAKDATLWRMNDIARDLGLSHTYFLNVSGLDISPTQAGAYGSAHDLAVLFAYAASTSRSTFMGTAADGLLLTSINGEKTHAFNTNSALGSIPGLVMGKTGYTDLAGGNLAILFNIEPSHPIIAIVLGSTEDGRFEDMKKLVGATEDTIGKTQTVVQ